MKTINGKNISKSKRTINHLSLFLTSFYLLLLLAISSLACHYSYKEKQEQILSTLDIALVHMTQEYKNIHENFLQVYMPIFEKDSSVYNTFLNYFTFTATSTDLSPLEKKELISALNQMKVRDSRIQWIGVFSDNRHTNYILYNDNTGLRVISESFPYLDELKNQTATMEVHAAKDISNSYGVNQTFAISGGGPLGMGSGRIIVGYSLSDFEMTSNFTITGIPSVRYYMTSSNHILFDSWNVYDNNVYFPVHNMEGFIDYQGRDFYLKSLFSGDNTSAITYSLSRDEMSAATLRDVPYILSLTAIFALFSLIIRYVTNHLIKKEIAIIQSGLTTMADNNIDYQLPTDFKQDGLPEIAHNINEMNSKLNENIKKAYYFELRQKDAQLAELQATFNPHFLYNTLEMLRGKSYSNGDVETSELISQLSALFRGLTNAKTFITIKEELAFGNRYLTLLIARYGNMVNVTYDIDSELLGYGIIRNVFQTIIENYFVHGFSSENTGNTIHFSGKSIDKQAMLLCIEDNGIGMNIEDIQNLNNRIEEPIRHGEKSYGLKNLNQRLKLFYGPDCGLHITAGELSGFKIQIRILKKYVDE